MMRRTVSFMLIAAAATAGCLSPGTDEIEGASVDAPDDVANALPETDVFKGSIMVSAASPLRTVNYGGEFFTALSLTDRVTGFVLELEWDAATPASEALSLWVRPAGAGNIDNPDTIVNPPESVARETGVSPLRIAVPASAFPEVGEYELFVRAADPAGLAVEQPFDLHVTTFEDLDFDDGYSALG